MKTITRAALLAAVVALGTSAQAQEAEEAQPAATTSLESEAAAGDMIASESAIGAEAASAPVDERSAESALSEDQAVGQPGRQELASQTSTAQRAVAVITDEQAKVIEGAPLGNSNVHVHIVERKPYMNEGRHELVLYPAIAQINSKFTTHVGAAATYAYHLFENLSLQLTPVFNYLNQESAFNAELIEKGHQQAQAATALLLQYGAVAGIEVTPMYGKFAVYEGVLGHFTFVLNAGAGVGHTRIQLRPEVDTNCGGANQAQCRDASFGDTGFKFLGSVGGGFRVFLGERAAVRLEVRDLIYTARVDRIDGCSYDDLNAIAAGGAAPNASCKPDSNLDDRQLAKLLLKETSSDVLNNISVYTGFSFLF
jgi:outer membrane beta-barrel protein